jgi:hypothetical protein
VILTEWVQLNNQLLLNTTKNITKGYDNYDDLYQSVIEQLLKKGNKLDDMDDKEKMYYFVRVVKNNFYSKSSPYYYQHIKNTTRLNYERDITNIDMVDEPYQEDTPDIEWVYKELDTLDWFSRDIFLMWMELGSLTAVARQTTIPLNSVGRYIKEVKQILNDKWERLK